MDKVLELSGWIKCVAKDTRRDYSIAQLTVWELRTALMLRMPASDATRVMTKLIHAV